MSYDLILLVNLAIWPQKGGEIDKNYQKLHIPQEDAACINARLVQIFCYYFDGLLKHLVQKALVFPGIRYLWIYIQY